MLKRTLIFAIFILMPFLVQPVAYAADNVNLPPHLVSVPLPKHLRIIDPNPSLAQNLKSFVGAWGVVKGTGPRPSVLIVKKVNKNGRARVIYALGESDRFEPLNISKIGKIDGDTLTISGLSGGATVYFTLDGDLLSLLWRRGDSTTRAKFERLAVE